MFPVRCGFCGHGNPAGARYCNACGGPLTSEPCPECGAVNNVMATTCQECGASLEDSVGNELFLPLPPEAPAGSKVASRSVEAPTEPLAARRIAAAVASVAAEDRATEAEPTAQRAAVQDTPLPESPPKESLPASPSEAPVRSLWAVPPDETATDKAEVAAADSARPSTREDSEPQPAAPSASAEAGAVSGPRPRTLWSVALVAALAVGGYFAYRHLHRGQPGDAPQAAATRDAKERTMPAAPDKPPAAAASPAPGATAKPIVRGEPAPAIFAPERGAAVVSPGSAAGGTGAGGSQTGDPAGIAAGKPQPPTDIFVAKPEPEPRRAAPPIQEAPKAAAAGAPRAAPCTDALAALGLCKQENNQRRE